LGFLIAEQNINVALKYASQAYVLDTGRVVLPGSAETLRTRDDLHDFYPGKH
jgi:branched-chain amino acid transport system ATP-binding protein